MIVVAMAQDDAVNAGKIQPEDTAITQDTDTLAGIEQKTAGITFDKAGEAVFANRFFCGSNTVFADHRYFIQHDPSGPHGKTPD